MKKGFTLIELMVVITIMGILAAVAVPKFFELVCASDLDRCKVNDSRTYELVCEKSKAPEVVAHCRSAVKHTAAPVVQQAPTVIHDTIRVVDTVYFDSSREACVKKCTDNNTSQSVINFCIKEECDKR